MLSYSSLRVNAFHCASSTLGLADSYPVAGEVCRAMIPSLGYNPAMATDSDWVIGSAPQSIEYVEISLHPLCVYTHICACYCQYWLWSSIIRAYKASTARHAALRSISSQMKSVVILADCEGIAVFKVQSHPRNHWITQDRGATRRVIRCLHWSLMPQFFADLWTHRSQCLQVHQVRKKWSN